MKNQLKSINYQLSNLKYVQDGWTVRLPSPFELDEIEPVQHTDILMPATISSASVKSNERPLTLRYFRNGNISFMLFPNGTGNIYYENGRLAIVIALVSLGMHIYVVLSNDSCQQVLATFDPYGNGCCNYGTGKLRIQMSPFGGYEIYREDGDDGGNAAVKRKRWLWWDFKEHVHAPPFQPFLLSLNENICVKIHSQESIHLSYRCEIHQLSFRVGSRLKVTRPESLADFQRFDSNDTFLRKRKARIEQLLNLMKNFMKKNDQKRHVTLAQASSKQHCLLTAKLDVKPKMGILKEVHNVSQMSTYRNKNTSKMSKFLIVP